MGSVGIRSVTASLQGLTLILRSACFTAIFSHPTIDYLPLFIKYPCFFPFKHLPHFTLFHPNYFPHSNSPHYPRHQTLVADMDFTDHPPALYFLLALWYFGYELPYISHRAVVVAYLQLTVIRWLFVGSFFFKFQDFIIFWLRFLSNSYFQIFFIVKGNPFEI